MKDIEDIRSELAQYRGGADAAEIILEQAAEIDRLYRLIDRIQDSMPIDIYEVYGEEDD